jgi:hypothetical protein
MDKVGDVMIIFSILAHVRIHLKAFYESWVFPYVLIILLVWGAFILVERYANLIVGGLPR